MKITSSPSSGSFFLVLFQGFFIIDRLRHLQFHYTTVFAVDKTILINLYRIKKAADIPAILSLRLVFGSLTACAANPDFPFFGVIDAFVTHLLPPLPILSEVL